MRHLALKIARIAAGVSLVILGVAGWILPIVPGWPFMLLGLGLLSVDIPAVQRLNSRLIAYLREKRAKLRR